MIYQSKYSWKNGYKPKVSADVVGNALAKMKEESEDGTVNASMLLEYSRPEDSETHGLFEWNDGIAAEKWRMYQSGRIINQLEVELVEMPNEKEHVVVSPIESAPTRTVVAQAFVNIVPRATARPGEYTDVITAFRNEEMRKRVLFNSLSELEAFKRKYERYEELADVIKAIDEFKGKAS